VAARVLRRPAKLLVKVWMAEPLFLQFALFEYDEDILSQTLAFDFDLDFFL
jgi:hypothetical protein